MTGRDYEVVILAPEDSLDEWDCFVDESPQGCVFCRSWWLGAVAPHRFTILTLRRGGRIVAGIPMFHTCKLRYHAIHMPPLTQTLGVLLAPPTSDSYEKRLSSEMETMEQLIAAIPQANYFSVNLSPALTNWLPFYWAGYRQTTRYSYVLPDLSDLDAVFSGFAHSKRKNIKKAEKEVTVHADLASAEFYANHRLTLSSQGRTISYTHALFERLYEASYVHEAGKTWYAVDRNGNLHATIFVVFDRHSAYYLISSIDPRFRNSGAATLLLKEAISFVSQWTNRFDFEGSMIREVEHSFRKFGAIQTPYFNISKGRRPLVLELCRSARALFHRAAARMSSPEEEPSSSPRMVVGGQNPKHNSAARRRRHAVRLV